MEENVKERHDNKQMADLYYICWNIN